LAGSLLEAFWLAPFWKPFGWLLFGCLRPALG
jgi:hypothetical protein